MRTRILTLPLLLFALTSLAQPGSDCSQALTASTNITYSPAAGQTWYSWTASANGYLLITTCGISECDTRIAVYDHCIGLITDAAGLNAVAYDDNTCAQGSMVSLAVEASTTYYIRITGSTVNCGPGEVGWRMTFDQPCAVGEVLARIQIDPDAWPGETSWELRAQDGSMLAEGTSISTAVCVPDGGCITLRALDSYGDGILAPGGFWFYINGMFIGSATGDFDFSHDIEGNCPPGSSCSSALTINEGVHEAVDAGTWYTFTPALNGNYAIVTCSYNDCDTRIWVYDHCQDLIWNETNVGTIAFNDDGCDEQSSLNAMLVGGNTYWIRVGGVAGSCANEPVDWELMYIGPISGCMDPNSCNYDPLAVEDDGSCLPFGDPNCPDAPDLLAREDILESSMVPSIEDLSGNYLCLLNEGCVSGFGERELVRFTTRIDNIGEQDFVIGVPSMDNEQFTYDPCHGHYHYVGYAEYLLFDMQGQQRAQGFKNGFCVFDLDCSNGGTGQFTCESQGLSSGCSDYYAWALSCQWIDITDVEDGDYKVVVRVNWDQDPDAYGRVESDFENNWAQMCINIQRTPNLQVTLMEPCEPYVDCMGVQFGSAQLDCNGVCAGTSLIGDLDVDVDQDFSDCDNYISGILGDLLTASTCNDANDDGDLTVTDVAMVANCHQFNTLMGPDAHSACEFPRLEIINIFDEVTFTLGSVDWINGSADVLMKNPERAMVGYELQMTGLHVTGVQSLTDPTEFPAVMDFSEGGHIMGLSYVDSTIATHTSFQPLFRVFFDTYDAAICISVVIDVVNQDYHNSVSEIEDGCVSFTTTGPSLAQAGIRLTPNPASGSAFLINNSGQQGALRLEFFDAQGRIVRTYGNLGAIKNVIDLQDMAPGPYLYRILGATTGVGSIFIE